MRLCINRLSVDPSNEMLQENVTIPQGHITKLEAEYQEQLIAVKAAFPRQVCCEAFTTGGCTHGTPCECGWMQARRGRGSCTVLVDASVTATWRIAQHG